MNHLTHAHKNGGWVLLQNIHLTIDWTSGPLEKRVDKLAEGAHPDFRCGAGRGALLVAQLCGLCWPAGGSTLPYLAVIVAAASRPLCSAAGCSCRRRRRPRWSARCPSPSCRPPSC